MQIETYETKEETIKGVELDSEAIELIRSLGLSGQERFIGESKNTGTATRSPYRLMTTTEYRVYRVLMPQRQELTKFNAEMIPLRVLQVAAHAKECGLFRHLEVWHDEGKDDPLLVGSTSTYGYGHASPNEAFILARWGGVLKPLEDLVQDAKQVVASLLRVQGEEMRDLANNLLENPDAKAELYLRTGKIPSTVYISVPGA